MEAYSVAISCLCVIVVTLSWWVLNWVWLHPKKLEKCLQKQGFKGNPYRLFFGDTKDRDRMLAEARSKPMPHFSNDFLHRVIPFNYHTVINHGDRCIIWEGGVPNVIILESEVIREIFMKIYEFRRPRLNPLVQKIVTGLAMLEGQEWAHRRKLVNPAFLIEKLKLMVPTFCQSCYDTIQKWDENVSKTGSYEVEASSCMQQLTADVISRVAFGSSYDEGRRIFELITEQLCVVFPLIRSIYISGWRFMPTKLNRKIMQADREIKTLLEDIIKKREKAIQNGEKPGDDLLGILMQSMNVKNRNNKTKGKLLNGLSLEEVINECKLFYLAGQETTSSLLVWTLILLAKHQDWQSRAREEVMATFGKTNLDFHELSRLKIMNMILQEVLRLYPPVTELDRIVEQDMKVRDIFLPAGVSMTLPILLLQHDKRLWGVDAKEFNPERFSEGISNATEGNTPFFSFGWGPRICIGSNFAMVEAKMTLALVLQRFSFELSPAYKHAPSGPGTLRPQFGAQIILRRI